MKGSGKYKGNSLNYTYSFDDRLINVIYSTLNGCAGMIWRLKALAGAGVNSDKNWTGGWRIR